MYTILSLGEILWDILPTGRTLGGAPLNVAAHFAALGNRSSILSRVGCDAAGDEAVSLIKQLGVDTTYIQRDSARPTGTATVTLSSDGIPEYDIPFEAGYNYITISDSIVTDMNKKRFDAVCFGTMAQKCEVSRASVRSILDSVKAEHVYLDVNFRLGFHPAEVLDYSFNKATIVKMNGEEASETSEPLFGEKPATGEFAEKLIERYCLDCLLITLGGDGCEVYCPGRYGRFAAANVKVSDTVGAGDAFSAGFLHEYLRSGDAFSAAVFANAVGAYVASKHGAVPALNMERIKELMIH